MLTTEFLIVGLLPAMARDLDVSIAQAGLLVTLFAFVVASAGPVLTSLFSHVERKKLFVAILVLFGLANALAATAPNIEVMAVARLVPGLALPVFWSLASATAVDLTGPARAGRAMSLVNIGIVCATVFGIPIGTLIADALSWRFAFGLLACVAFAKAAVLQVLFPTTNSETQKVSLAQQIKVLRDPVITGHVLLSILVHGGMLTGYTYLAEMLERLGGFDGRVVGWTLMAFGAIGIVGNVLGGKAVDRNALGSSLIFNAVLAVGMVMVVPSMSSGWGLAGTLGVWGIAQSALFIVCHVRMMKVAPRMPAFAASLNISGANIGIGLGALVGGRVINSMGMDKVGLAGAAILGIAMLLTVVLISVSRPPVRISHPQ